MGTLLKRLVQPQAGNGGGGDGRRLYHAAVMPCYDRKLEAARPQLTEPASGAPETDCVLATAELQLLLGRAGVDPRRDGNRCAPV